MDPTISDGAFIAGIFIYLAFFKRFEHHLYPQRYFQAAFWIVGGYVFGQHYLYDVDVSEAIKASLFISSIFFTGLLSSVTVYRLFLNPLNAIPGPYFARLTGFSNCFRNTQWDNYHQLRRLHQQYGDFIRIGPNHLSVTDPAGVQVLFGPQTKCSKSPEYDADYPSQSMHTIRDKETHDKRRRIWASAFSDKALRGYESRIGVYNDLLVKRIEVHSGKSIDVSKWFNFYSFDVMGDLGFGSSFNMLDRGEAHWATTLLHDGIELLGYMFPIWFARLILQIPGLVAKYLEFVAFCAQRIDERVKRQDKSTGQDIAHFLIDGYERDEDKRTALLHLHDDSMLVIVAGSDTTTAALTYLFYYLARDEEVVRKLRDEIGSLSVDGQSTALKLQDARYLNGCIYEALRLNPPVPSGVLRRTPEEGVTIGDTFIAGNTTIQMPGFVIGHKDSIYPDAEAFIPERWSTKPELIKHKDAFQPFASGWGGCIGKNLAMMELRTVTARLVTLFDIALAPGEDGKNLLEKSTDHFTVSLQPLNLVFTKRESS